MDIVSVSSKELVPGMVLAQPISLSPNSPTIYRPKGHLLTSKDIDWISKKGLETIEILTELGNLEKILNQQIPLIFSQETKSPNIFSLETQSLIKKSLRAIDISNVNFLRDLYKLDSKEHNSLYHVLDVMALNIALGKYIGFSEDEIFITAKCGLFHDIGKFRDDISCAISSKNGLSDEQRQIMELHPKVAYDFILENYPNEIEVMQAAGGHHFYSNGFNSRIIGGYGDKRIKELSKYARLTRLCDVYGALTSNRLQGRLMGHDEAIRKMIQINIGMPFDEIMFKNLKDLSEGKKPNYKINLN